MSFAKRRVATTGSRDCQLPSKSEELCADMEQKGAPSMASNAGDQIQPALAKPREINTCQKATTLCAEHFEVPS